MLTLNRVWNLGWVMGAVLLFGAIQAAAMPDANATTAVQNDIAAVPEPGAALLFAAGVGLVAFSLRRTRS